MRFSANKSGTKPINKNRGNPYVGQEMANNTPDNKAKNRFFIGEKNQMKIKK
jgi:hypothetical protein